jgi:hypothetical protein
MDVHWANRPRTGKDRPAGRRLQGPFRRRPGPDWKIVDRVPNLYWGGKDRSALFPKRLEIA